MDERIAELAALVDRSRCFGGDVAGNSAGERELPEQPADAFLVGTDLRVDLGIRTLQVCVRYEPGSAVTWTGDEDRVEIALTDRPVHVDVEEVQPRGGSPVPEQTR